MRYYFIEFGCGEFALALVCSNGDMHLIYKNFKQKMIGIPKHWNLSNNQFCGELYHSVEEAKEAIEICLLEYKMFSNKK